MGSPGATGRTLVPMPTESVGTPQVPLWNLANVLTMVRVALVPVFAVLMVGDSTAARIAAAVVFLVAAATDKLDGYIARSRNLVTNFGKIADPIADKALMIGALVGLNIIELLPWWITAIIVVRELGITLWRVVQLRRGHVVPASKGGKLKTVAQSLAVALFLMPLAWLFWPAWIVMIIAVAITVVTGIQYIVDSRKAAA